MDENTVDNFIPEQSFEEQAQVDQPLQEQVAVQAQPESNKEYNNRILREKLDAERREKERYMRENEALRAPKNYEYQQTYNKPQQQNTRQFSPDDVADVAYVNERIAEQAQTNEDLKRAFINMNAENKIRAEFPDYHKVVNEETVAQFAEIYPNIAAGLANNPDLYSKAASTYELIKKYGLAPADHISHDKLRMEQNAMKPRTASGNITQKTNESALQNAHLYQARSMNKTEKAEQNARREKARRGFL